MRKIVLSICAILLLGFTLSAQNQRVSGTVTDSDGSFVTGAMVVLQGTQVVAVTGIDGQYSISVPADGILEISHMGMVTQTVPVSGRTVINVRMEIESTVIDEVFVVAYGTARRESFTGSAAVIGSQELQNRRVSNVTKALDGLAPGVQSTLGSGQPGEGASIMIRGFGSINASSTPLYVVDGMPYSGQISAINPDDIESISILKDASAAVLYGSRGANGVVMVTTKKGRKDGFDVDVKINFGVSSRALPRYETMNEREWVEALYSAFYNQAVDNGTPPSMAGQVALYNMSNGPQRIFGNNEMYNPFNVPVAQLIDTQTGRINPDANLLWNEDWIDEATNKAALRQEYIASISGGGQQSQYMFSMGYLKEEGVLKTTSFQRFTGRLNIEMQPKEWFHTGFGVNFSQNTSNYDALTATGSTASSSNIFYSGMLMAPIYPVFQRDPSTGKLILDDDGNRQFDYGPSRPSGQQTNFNSVATLFDDRYDTQNENLSARTHMDFLAPAGTWAEGLKFQVGFGADYYNNRFMLYYNPEHGNAGGEVGGRLRRTNTYNMSYTFNQLLFYDREFGPHNLSILAGHEYYDLHYMYLRGERTGFPFPRLYELSMGSVIVDAYSTSDIYRVDSYLSRINYDYADKYYFSASYRRDASSRFHPDHRWADFWSVGGNWRISQEDFMSDVDWVNNLSIKASYGVQGNDSLLNSDGTQNYYAWQALYNLTWTNAGMPGALITDLSNPYVTWEPSHNFNVGLEARLFNNRLSLSVEWYNRTTKDMLLEYPLPMSTGFEYFWDNVGVMRNRGLEVDITGQIINNRDFQWAISLMGTTINNKVLQLIEGQDIILNTNYIIREGEALYSFYTAQSAGIDPANGQQLYWATKEENGEMVRYITSNATQAQASRTVTGSRIPDLYGSITNMIRWKNFDFTMSFNYSTGGQVLDGVYSTLMSFYYAAQAKHVDLKRAWKQPGDITDVRRYQIGETPIITDDDLINASYFAIKNISLGYTLPESVLESIGFKSVRVSVSADNVAMFSHLKGMNPQYNFTGGTSYTYSPTRTISFNLDLKF